MKPSILSTFLNPVKLYKAYQFHKTTPKYNKSNHDLELMLYAQLLTNDMLHFGYFDDISIPADNISIHDIENAQIRYAHLLMENIHNKDGLILDIGCGMGGLSNMLFKEGYKIHALTPNITQIKHLQQKNPLLVTYHLRFEDIKTSEKFDTLINSESLQYIQLNNAFKIADEIINLNGRWLITDFFRTTDNAINKSGHYLEDFLQNVKQNNWEIIHEQDISLNALPTLKVIDFYCNRFLKPLAYYATEKLRYKQPWLYYLMQDFKEKFQLKIDKELASIEPDKFMSEKKYMFYVLKKRGV